MNNFHKLASGVDVITVAHAITRRPYLWEAGAFAQGGPLGEIWLRYSNPARVEETGKIESLDAELECVDLPEFSLVPQARKVVFDLMQRIEGERLGRVTVLRLPRGGSFEYEAGEQTPYAEYYTPYMVCLSGVTASRQGGMSCAYLEMGDDNWGMMTGDVFWFDHRSPYKIVNESPDDLLLMRIDVRVAA
jgi:hypothetical protein